MPFPAAARWLSLPLAVATLVLPLLWWTWPEDLPLWRSAGIVAAWAGCGLLLASLLLMIREAWLARLLGGLERMYRWHHVLGVMAYVLLLAHPLLLAVAYDEESSERAWQLLSPWQANASLGFGWLALLLLMLGLALALSRRLNYRRWRLLHFLLAPALLAGFVHLHLLGIAEQLHYIAALASLFMIWRLLRADCAFGARPYLTYQISHPGRDIIEIGLRPLAHPLQVSPGQFVMARFGNSDSYCSCGESHPFTVSAIDRDGCLRLCIKALGPCSQHLQTLPIGAPARLEGPFGELFLNMAGRPEIWLAGGIGITPFLARLREGKLNAPVQLHYFYRERSAAPCLDELTELSAQSAHFRLFPRPDQPDGQASSAWPPGADALAGHVFRLCGPPAWLEIQRHALLARGVPAGDIYLEHFNFR